MGLAGSATVRPVRVVFLDFDGVLNSRRFFAQRPQTTGADDALDEGAVARLNRIIERSGAKVVISSTWRITEPLPRIVAILGAHGFRGEVIGVTPTRGGSRGGEIKAWLDENRGVSQYVVLDDAKDIGPVAASLVQTHVDDGLLDEHVDAACAMLERRGWWAWWRW